MNFLELDVKTSLSKGFSSLLLPHPTLKEIINSIERRNLEIVITYHLCYEICQFAVIRNLRYLPLASFSDIRNYLLVFTFGIYFLLLLPCQKSIGHNTQIEHKIFLELLRSKICFILTCFFKLRILFSHSISNNMLFLCSLHIQKGLEVYNFQRVSMEINPLRNNCRTWMKTLDIFDSFKQVSEKLVKGFLRNPLDCITQRQ